MNNRVIISMFGLALPLAMLSACDDAATTPTKTSDSAKVVSTAATAKAQPKTGDAPATGAPKLAEAKGSYKLDPGHSVAIFRASHFGLSNSYGRFNKLSGALTLDEDPSKSSIEIEIDANSIFTADRKRDDHLKGTDFFNVEQFPVITFKSKAVSQAGPGNFKVKGDLALHGVTKEVTVNMKHIGAGEFPMDKSYRTGFEGEFTIKRSDYDMKNMLKGIGDEVKIIIAVEAIRG